MAKFQLEIGATADILSPGELRDELIRAEIRAAAKSAGYKPAELFLPVGAATYQDSGPAAGFAWKLRMITCVLAAAGTIAAFKGEGINGRPVGTAQSVSAAGLNIAGIFYPDDIIVQSDQQIFVSAGAGTIVSYYRVAVQVPAQRLGEHLS